MAWDSKTTRRRQSSNAASRPKPPTSIDIEPKSAHVSDPALQPFLHATFDPTSYLNSVLPPLQISSNISRQPTNLSSLSAETQTLLSTLSAHTTRLTTTLTQLTDEILRSGSRLAYEVEVLRGETLGLSEALTDGLKEDVTRFVPNGLDEEFTPKAALTAQQRRRSSTITSPKPTPKGESPNAAATDPPHLTQLRTLTHVLTRLQLVTSTFSDAMTWPIPPSELSLSTSFLSVSAPEANNSLHSYEEKAQAVSQALRDEIQDLLDGEDPIDGIENAAARVAELRELAQVWRGTAEERARMRFVDGLARVVEEKHRELVRQAEGDGRLRRVETTAEVDEVESKERGGYGFLSRLRELRGGP